MSEEPKQPETPPPKPRRRGGLLSVVRIVMASYLGLVLLAFIFQGRLLFHPSPLAEGRAAALTLVPGVEAISVRMSDGVTLRGWLRHPAERAPLLLYFGGNAEEVSWHLDGVDPLPQWAQALVNYRGYGESEGSPGEAELFSDALALYDALTQREDIDGTQVAAIGRSLGTGVAVHLAAHRRLKALVLVTPYDSVREVAKGFYPFLPVGLLLRHPFDALALAPKVKTSTLVLAASHDRIIPPSHARRLFDALPQPKRWVLAEGRNHATVVADEGYWPAIQTALAAKSPAR